MLSRPKTSAQRVRSVSPLKDEPRAVFLIAEKLLGNIQAPVVEQRHQKVKPDFMNGMGQKEKNSQRSFGRAAPSASSEVLTAMTSSGAPLVNSRLLPGLVTTIESRRRSKSKGISSVF